MSTGIKKFVIINGSPKTSTRSVSGALAAQAADLFRTKGIETSVISARHSQNTGANESSFADMRGADGLLFVFPLYYFCVPSLLMRFMQDYADSLAASGGPSKPQQVCAVVNCGFPEPDINEEAVRVIQSFSRHISASFRFGVLLGCGGMIAEAKDAPFMKKAVQQMDQAFSQMAQDVLDGNEAARSNVSIAIKVPRKLYYFMGNRGWFSLARGNKLKKKDLYARPYAPGANI